MNNSPQLPPPKVSDTAQLVLFKTLWDRIPQRSFVSGLWLRVYANTSLWPDCFLYVLPTDKYKYFKYFFGNIILCTPGERGLWMQGSEEERIQYSLSIEEQSRGKATADWKAVKELEEDLIKQYKKSFPSTWGMFVGYQYNLKEQAQIIGRLNSEFWKGFK